MQVDPGGDPFESKYVNRCSFYRRVLSCFGVCNDCCSVAGFPTKNQGHLERRAKCYWIIWVVGLLALLFLLGFGISLLFRPRTIIVQPPPPTIQRISNVTKTIPVESKQIVPPIVQQKPKEEIVPFVVQKEPEIIAPIVSTDRTEELTYEPKPPEIEIINPIVSTDTNNPPPQHPNPITYPTTVPEQHPRYMGDALHPHPVYTEPIQEPLLERVDPLKIVKTKIYHIPPAVKVKPQYNVIVMPKYEKYSPKEIMLMREKIKGKRMKRYKDMLEEQYFLDKIYLNKLKMARLLKNTTNKQKVKGRENISLINRADSKLNRTVLVPKITENKTIKNVTAVPTKSKPLTKSQSNITTEITTKITKLKFPIKSDTKKYSSIRLINHRKFKSLPAFKQYKKAIELWKKFPTLNKKHRHINKTNFKSNSKFVKKVTKTPETKKTNLAKK